MFLIDLINLQFIDLSTVVFDHKLTLKPLDLSFLGVNISVFVYFLMANR